MAKKGQISFFEVQKANKPKIEEICEQILTDSTLKNGMSRLLELSKEIKMKPCWQVTNGYGCNYKGKRVVQYRIGRGDKWETNYLKIFVFITDNGDLDNFFQNHSDEMITECLKGMKCQGCGGCKPGIKYTILGKQQYVCWKLCYQCLNPTAEQFEWIEKMILARREYIKSTAV